MVNHLRGQGVLLMRRRRRVTPIDFAREMEATLSDAALVMFDKMLGGVFRRADQGAGEGRPLQNTNDRNLSPRKRQLNSEKYTFQICDLRRFACLYETSASTLVRGNARGRPRALTFQAGG